MTRSTGDVQVQEQVSSLWKEVASCYKNEHNNPVPLILVPLGLEREALYLQSIGILQLGDSGREIVVLVDNLEDTNFEAQLQPRNQDQLPITRGLVSLLKFRGHSVHISQLDPRARPEQVMVPLVEWINQSSRRTIIVCCNLGTGTNAQKLTEKEDKLIVSLLNPDIPSLEKLLVDQRTLRHSTSLLLLTITRIADLQKWNYGRVLCYSDSRGWRREGWINSEGPEIESYSVISWTLKDGTKTTDPILSYDRYQAISLARSIVAAVVLEAPMPLLPSWSPWYQRYNGIFVGVYDSYGPVASVGHYQDPQGKRTLPQNLEDAASQCPRDSRERWKRPITGSNVWDLNYDVKVLQPYQQWVHLNPQQIVSSSLTPEDGWGFQLTIPSLDLKATYLPSVWRQNPEWNLEQLLQRLTVKAGGSGPEWMSYDAIISLYSVVELLQCPSLM